MLVSLITLIGLGLTYFIWLKLSRLLIRPILLPLILNLDPSSNIRRINKKLNQLQLQTIRYENLSPFETLDYTASHWIINWEFDFIFSSSMQLIHLFVWKKLVSSSVIDLNWHLCINGISLAVTYVVPMTVMWFTFAGWKLPVLEKWSLLGLYAVAVTLTSIVLVRFALDVDNLPWWHLHLLLIDLLGVCSIAVINLATCVNGVLNAVWYYKNDKVNIAASTTKRIKDLQCQSPMNLSDIESCCDELKFAKAVKGSLYYFLRIIYWVYCIIRSIMWVLTLFSIFSITTTSTLRTHKRDQTSVNILNSLVELDPIYIDVVVSLISLCSNVASALRLAHKTNHIAVMAFIIGVSTLVAFN